MGEHFSSSSRDLVGSFLRTYSFSLSLPSLATPRLSSSEERLLPKLMLMLMLVMDMELFPQLQFLLQCVTLSQKKCARIGPLRPQEKFATPNTMKLLTPPSLNIVKRLSPLVLLPPLRSPLPTVPLSMESLDMVLLPLAPLSALLVLVPLLEVLLLLDTESVKLRLMLMLMPMLDMVMLAQLLHLLPSATVFPSEPATRSLSAPPGRSPRLSARRSLISRSSRIVLIPSAPPVLSNLSSSLIPPLLLELTPGLDPKLSLLPTEPLLLVLLPLLLPMVVLLLPLLPDMLAPESDLLDMLDTNFSISSLFILSHYFISPTSLV